MWKLFLIIFLAIESTNTIAEWMVVEKNNSEGMTRYVDISTIKKINNKTRMVDLIDYQVSRVAIDDKFLSIKIVQEYDCNETRKRILAFNTYIRNMGKGEVVYRDTSPNEWKIIPSFGHTGMKLWKIACNI
tara:strand:- start:9005 stop:9397 length:393 start_codon:yes stop_codon:yes gene_type:complete